MSQQFRIGPGYILIADSVQAPLADWRNMGKTRGDILFNFEPGNLSFTRTDQSGVAKRSDLINLTGQNANIQAPLLDRQINNLLRANPQAVSFEQDAKKAIGFSKGSTRLAPTAVAIVPVEDYRALDDWRESEQCMWIRDAVAHVTGPFTMALPDGDDSLETAAYEVTFQSLHGSKGSGPSMGYGVLDAIFGSPLFFGDDQLFFDDAEITYS